MHVTRSKIIVPEWLNCSTWKTPRWKAAISRGTLSKPVQLARMRSLIHLDSEVLDIGCGKGDDVERLNSLGRIQARGFDPYYFPDTSVLYPAEIVCLIYVLNVIEDPEERAEVLRFAWSLTNRALIVAVRSRQTVDVPEVVTRIGTFQKYYTRPEWHQWMHSVLGDVTTVHLEQTIAFVYKN